MLKKIEIKDKMIPCQHTLSEDVVYKEVVVIGNGPSGMVTSFMLAGNVPYLKPPPEDLPIDDMLRARLSNLPEGKSLYEIDLMELAEGLEGRSQNPIPLLMDNLLRPCADLGIQTDSLIEWKYDVDKQIEHVVLGRGPPGGAWHTFPPSVRTLSPGAWLALPPHAPRGSARLSARAVAHYCTRYVRACRLQRYFRNNVVVTCVRVAPPAAPPERCPAPRCPLAATYLVCGVERGSGRPFRYACRRVVVCSGAQTPRSLPPRLRPHLTHSLHRLQGRLAALRPHGGAGAAVVVVGSGVSGADAVLAARAAGARVAHVHAAPAPALARLHPAAYPDYCQVYKMMCDGPSGNHPNYTPYPDYIITDITPIEGGPNDYPPEIEKNNLTPKRVKLFSLTTKETTEVTANIIAVFIGSKPDLSFLQTNYDCIDMKCQSCLKNKHRDKIEEKRSFKNQWLYLKNVLGQSIQSCNRLLNLTDYSDKCECVETCDIDDKDSNCDCEENPFSDGIGFGVDPTKPIDSKNPIAIDKYTHEVLNAPKGMYALGPLTNDNFMRFIPGGALAIVAHMHKDK